MGNRLATMLSKILGGPEITDESVQRTKERLTGGAMPSGFGRVMAGLHEEASPRHRKILADGAMSALKLTGFERLDGPEVLDHLVRILDATNVIVGKTLSRGGVEPNLLYVAALVDQASRWCGNEGLEYFDAFIEFMIAAKNDSIEHAKTCPFHEAKREHGKDSFSPEMLKAALLKLMENKRKEEEAEPTGDPAVDALVAGLGRLFGVQPEFVELRREPGESEEAFLARAEAKEKEIIRDGAHILGRQVIPGRPGGKTGFFDPSGLPIGRGEPLSASEVEQALDQIKDEEELIDQQTDGVK